MTIRFMLNFAMGVVILCPFAYPCAAQRDLAGACAEYSLSEAACDAVSKFASDADALLAKQRASGPPKGAADALARAVDFDQATRIGWYSLRAKLSPADRSAANPAVVALGANFDKENILTLKRYLPADGWFRFSREGEQTSRDAALILIHSSDREFQHKVLGLLPDLVRKGEANGSDYALLFDKVAMAEGRPQRFGTQMMCIKNVLKIADVESPEQVDRLRAEVGISQTLAAFAKEHHVGGAC